MNTNPFDEILLRIKQTRSRMRMRALFITMGWLGVAWLLIFLVGTLFISAYPTTAWLKWALWAALSISAVLLSYRFLIREIRLSESNIHVAEQWEHHVPSLADGLIASVQFAEEWQGHFRGSREMAHQLAVWVGQEIREKKVSDVISLRPIRLSWSYVGLLCVTWLGTYVMVPDYLMAGIAALTQKTTIGHEGTRLEKKPLVGDVTLTLTYPKYMNRDRRVVPNSTGNLSVAKGTQILVEATTVEAAQSAFLMLDDKELVAQLTDGRKLKTMFTVKKSVDWRFGMLKLDGLRTLEEKGRRISIRPDKAPSVRLKEPSKDQELKNIRDVPVEFSARDDFGLGRVCVAIALANDLENPVRIEQGGVKGQRYRGADEVDLSVIDAQPGDRIALFVEAYDNNKIDGAQRGISEIRYITIRSPLSNHLALTEELNNLVGTLLDRLADRLEFNVNKKDRNQLVDNHTRLNLDSRKAIDEVRSITTRMEDDPLTPKEVRAGLVEKVEKTRASLNGESGFLRTWPQRPTPIRVSDQRDAKNALNNVVDQVEILIIYIEAVVARLALENMSALAQEMKDAKDRLRELITAYRDNPNEALKSRILRNIKRLKERMAELQSRLAKLRQKLPKEFLNIDGLKQNKAGKGLSKTRSQLDEIEKMLNEGRIEDALKAVEDMSKSLDDLASTLDKDMQDLHDSTNPEKQRAISELMDRTRDLMNRQDELRKETKKQAEQERQAQKRMLDDQFKKQLDEIKQEVTKLRGNVDDLARAPWTTRSDDDLNTLNERVSGLYEAVMENQLVPALERAEKVLPPLNQLKYASRFLRSKEAIGAQVEIAKERDVKIIRMLSKLLNDLRQQMNQEEGGQGSESLRQQQAALQQSTQQLKRELSQKQSKIPGLGGGAGQQIQGAEKAMGQAKRELGRRRPGRARPGQDEAVSQLRSVMKSLKNAAKPQKANRGQEKRGRESYRKVKIPGADEHKTPDAFRKDLLDAMKDKAPKEYRESVKKYYESLVK